MQNSRPLVRTLPDALSGMIATFMTLFLCHLPYDLIICRVCEIIIGSVQIIRHFQIYTEANDMTQVGSIDLMCCARKLQGAEQQEPQHFYLC